MAKEHVASGEFMPRFHAFPPNRHVSRKLRVFVDWIVELLARRAPVVHG